MKYTHEQLAEQMQEFGGGMTYRLAGKTIYCKGGGGGGTTVTKQEIPKELKPLATAYTNKAIDLSNQGFIPYMRQRFANLNNVQGAGLGMTIDRALNGSPVADKANETLMQTLQGGQTNPYLDSMVQRAQDSVKSNFNTAAVNSGSFGNSGLQEQFTKNLGDTASQMYGQAYEGDRQRQMSALQLAPTYAQQDYQDASQLLNAGQILQNQDQQNKDFAYQQFQDWQNDPYKKLAAMSGVFGTNLGGTSTTTQSGGGDK